MSRLEDFIKKAKAVHGDKYDYSKVKYVNSHTKIKIGCKQHNVWFEQSPTNHLTGKLGCKFCQIEPRKNAFIEKSKELYGNKYDYSEVKYVNNGTNIKIYCKKHNIWFKQLPLTHLSGSVGCKKCQLEKTGEKFIAKAKELYGNKYDYSEVEYVNNRTKVKIYSNEYKMWFLETPRSHLEQSVEGMSFVGAKVKNFFEKSKKLYGDKYDYSNIEFVNNTTKVNVYCKKHKLWFEQTVRCHLVGKTGCVECSKDDRKSTNIKKYGVEHPTQSKEIYKKIKETNLKNFGVECVFESKKVKNKSKFTSLKRYGVENPMQSPYIQNKINLTKRRNQTFNTSKSEEIMFEKLVKKFGEDDVLRQYKSEKYPFLCDFYIKSLDLYIELNASWTHGGHWFDENNKEDVKTFSYWKKKSKTSDFYYNAIKVWTVRDVEKRSYLEKLNNKVFWDNNLDDFNKWIGNLK